MICQRCQHQSSPMSYQRDGNWMLRCERCGTPHSCARGRAAEAIGPELLSIHQSGVVSPWFDGRYRPYRGGVYECEFTTGHRLRLVWRDGGWWWTTRAVDVSELLKWRGMWQRP